MNHKWLHHRRKPASPALVPVGAPGAQLAFLHWALTRSGQDTLRSWAYRLVLSPPEAPLGFSPSHQLAGAKEGQELRAAHVAWLGWEGGRREVRGRPSQPLYTC